jgi:hypothetical protein
MKKLLSAILALCHSLFFSNASAVILSLLPASQTASSGDSVSLDLVIDGLGNFAPDSVGDFDVDISYDMTKLTFDSYNLGGFLGDAVIWEAVDLSSGDWDLDGVINIGELSLLDANNTSGPSDYGPFLDDIQPSSFTLATLDFTVNYLAEGSSTIVGIETVSALGDGYGMYGSPLTLDESNDAVIRNPGVVVPEPSTLMLMLIGLIGMGLTFKKKIRIFNHRSSRNKFN